MNPLESRFPKPETKPRMCLKCWKTFQSTGPANRICKKCGATNSPASRCETQGTSILAEAGEYPNDPLLEGFA